jgi:hypothetical protein
VFHVVIDTRVAAFHDSLLDERRRHMRETVEIIMVILWLLEW